MSARAAIGWIPTSSDLRVPSARLRCALPARYLRKAGWSSQFFTEGRADQYDIVVFQKRYDEAALELAERLRERGTQTVFDLCDNHFFNPDGRPALAERVKRLQRMLELADAVSVSTPTLAGLVSVRAPVVIDDALDTFRIALLTRARKWLQAHLGERGPLQLVWFGSAGTESPPFGLAHLPRILPALEDINGHRPLRLTVISNSRTAYERATEPASFPTRYVEWTPTSFARIFPTHDVCVIPIETNPFTSCKTANRVALSLRLGVPVIADRIPSFNEFSPFVQLGSWRESLERYASDPALRAAQAEEGRRYVEATYTPERVVAQWSSLFRELQAKKAAVRGMVAR
jgi:glycosyltransferase involved in cell wall biosynthesis